MRTKRSLCQKLSTEVPFTGSTAGRTAGAPSLTQSPTEPRNHHRWFTHGAKTLLDLSAGPISPQNAGLEEVRRCAAAELQSPATRAAAVAPLQPEPPNLEAAV